MEGIAMTTLPYMTTALYQRLNQAATEREAAERLRNATSVQLHRIVREADEAGWPKTRIAEVAGISRQTVHQILREDPK